jgi:hypothetical protein
MTAIDDDILPAGQKTFTSKQLAEALGTSRGYFNQKRFTGDGPRFQKLGAGKRSRVVYKRGDVLAWLHANEHLSTGEYA